MDIEKEIKESKPVGANWMVELTCGFLIMDRTEEEAKKQAAEMLGIRDAKQDR